MGALTFGDLLFSLNTGVLFLIAVLAAGDYLRERDPSRLDVAALLGVQALSFLLSSPLAWSYLPALATLATLIGLATPLLKLRLVRHFRAVPAWVLWAALVGYAICAVCVMLWWPVGYIKIDESPLYVRASVVPYAAAVEGLVVGWLLFEAGRTRGITRLRLTLASGGSVLFLLSYAGEFLLTVMGYPGPAILVFRLFSTLSAAFFYLGFASPRWLRQAFQYSELYHFLRQSPARQIEVRSVEALRRLCPAAVRAVGGVRAVVALWDESEQQLVFWPPDEEPPFHGRVPCADGLIGRAWTRRQAYYAQTPVMLGPSERALAGSVGAGALMAVPIATNQRIFGLLLVFLRRGSLFPEDDITLLSLMAEHEARFEELERVNRSKSDFLASVSHDLRTPLTVLLAHVEALQRGIPDDPQHSISLIHDKAVQLRSLVDDLFELARLEDARAPWKPQRINLAELVRRALLSNLTMLEDAGLRLEEEIPEEPIWAMAVPGKLERVMENLLTNACRYGADGKRVSVTVTAQDRWVRVEVSDWGPGVAPEQRERIFDRFHQGKAGSPASSRGAGLGLAIVREIVVRHGGQIGVVGGPEGGARFWFALPVLRTHD